MLKQVLSQHDIFTEVVQKILKLSSDTMTYGEENVETFCTDVWFWFLISEKQAKPFCIKWFYLLMNHPVVVCMLKLTQL